MDVKAGIGIGTGLLALVGGLFAFDARYEHVQAAEQAVQQLHVDIETLRLKNEIATTRARLSFLANKSDATPDEKLELDFQRKQLELLQAQLAALQK